MEPRDDVDAATGPADATTALQSAHTTSIDLAHAITTLTTPVSSHGSSGGGHAPTPGDAPSGTTIQGPHPEELGSGGDARRWLIHITYTYHNLLMNA